MGTSVATTLFLEGLVVLLRFPRVFTRPFLLLYSVLLLGLLYRLVRLLRDRVR